MKTTVYISIAMILAALLTTSARGKNPETTTKIRDILVHEKKVMVLTHLRANPDPRSVAIYNEYVAKRQAEKIATTAKLD